MELAAAAPEAPAQPSRVVALIIGEKNERGIPSAVFIDDIAAFMAANDVKLDDLYNELNTMYSKYKMMEQQLEEGQARAKSKVPELEASLDSLDMLEKKQAANETATAFYNLSDNVFVQAKIVPRDLVAVWMGAGIMLDYSYAEARVLLSEQLQAAKTKMSNNSSDLSFLREQIITIEVNSARVYNLSVRTRRSALATAPVPAA